MSNQMEMRLVIVVFFLGVLRCIVKRDERKKKKKIPTHWNALLAAARLANGRAVRHKNVETTFSLSWTSSSCSSIDVLGFFFFHHRLSSFYGRAGNNRRRLFSCPGTSHGTLNFLKKKKTATARRWISAPLCYTRPVGGLICVTGSSHNSNKERYK